MKKYLVNANLKETFYPGRFMFVVLTIDDNILTNTYWGTTKRIKRNKKIKIGKLKRNKKRG